MARSTKGWRNVWRGSDPALSRTFDSISDWSSKLGVGFTIKLPYNQSIPPQVFGVGTNILWREDGVLYDPYNFWPWDQGTGTPGTRTLVTPSCPQGLDGEYLMVVRLRWQLNTTGNFRGIILKNAVGVGTENFGANFLPPPVSTTPPNANENLVAGIVQFRPNDHASVMAYQDTAVNLNALGTPGVLTSFTARRIGDYRDWSGL